jgi:hypothetical protein
LAILRADAAVDAPPLVSLPSNNGTDRKGSVDLGTGGLAPGAYAVALRDAGGQEIARTPFWIVARDGAATLALDKSRYAPGETITATWSNAPGNRYDWLGVFKKDDPADDHHLHFFYVNAAVGGSLALTTEMLGAALAPGSYELRLELDDGCVRLAVAAFDVK